MLTRLIKALVLMPALVVFVFAFVMGACVEPDTVPCPTVILVGVAAHVQGLEDDTYQINYQQGDGPWESCAAFNRPGNCAQDIVGPVTVRVTADDGRVQTRDVVIEGDVCGPLFPTKTILFSFDSLNG